MSSQLSSSPSSEKEADLSGLGRALLGTGGSTPSSGPWVPPPAEELGRLLPEYEIVRMLGRGGMGAVYMGRQISLDRSVAIKILSGTLEESDMGFVERFKNEARAMGKLNHPGIVAVHDFGETVGGLLYIVMEYVEGTDVARMIAKEGRLHTDHAMAITAHVCDALSYAHERGIIHRDIKPANIMVGYDGVVKVADFGLAKMTHSQNSGLTQSGMAMGTLHYMAPEALMLGSAVDHRADIYAVGVMLYQMLTGKIPQGMFKLPSLQIAGLDPRYDGIIAKAIMEDREARYQKVGEMRRDLDGILTQPVVKVEAEVSQAPAALPTQARPQRPGGQPYRPPRPVAQPQMVVKSSAGLIWTTLLVLAVFGGIAWLVLDQPGGKQSAVAEESPAIEVSTAPVTFKATTAASQPTAGTLDLMNLAEWQRQGDAEWEIEDGAFVSRPSPQGHLHRILGFDDFELTGEARTSAEGNGGIWVCAASMNLENPGGYEFQICGSVASGGKSKTGSLLIGRALVSILDSEVPDNSWVAFRIRREGGTLQGWLDGRQTFSTTLLPESERALGRIIALHRWDKAGTVSYRGLKVTPLKKGVSVIPPPASTLAPTVQSGVTPHQATKDKPFVNSLGMKFVPVRITGGPTDGKTLLFSVWETRVRDFAEFSKANATSDTSWQNLSEGGVTQTGDHPVVNVTWDDAVRFCEWLTKKEGILCRLPSDHEWSCAAGIGSDEDPSLSPVQKSSNRKLRKTQGAVYPWEGGENPPVGFANYNGTQTDAFLFTAPVGSFPATTNGLHDLWGNASEWCADWHDPSIKVQRVTRGHSWQNWGPARVVNWRMTVGRDGDGKMLGFRVILEIPVTTTSSSSSAPSAPTTPQVPATAGSTVNLLQATKEKPFVNSLGMKFVPVPGTKVLMCIHETRYKDYAAYAGENPGVDSHWKVQTTHGFSPTDRPEDHPVTCTGWDDAQEFCAWLTQKEPGRVCRLPTDEEWSFAVGLGRVEKRTADTTPQMLSQQVEDEWPWGTQWPPPKGSGNYSDQSLKAKLPRPNTPALDGYDDGYPTTAPVMSFAPNQLGFYDLGGNVWEWCEDLYDNQINRVMRGGSCFHRDSDDLLSSNRHRRPPSTRHDNVGFRVVIEIPAKATTVTPSAPVPVAPSALPAPAPVRVVASVAASTPAATKENPFINTLGMKFVPVPGTKVLMCIHETRRRDFAAFDAKARSNVTFHDIPVNPTDDHPAIALYNEAERFHEWLGQKEGRKYRLPTDREWSIAVGIAAKEDARRPALELSGKVAGHYPWGRDFPPSQVIANLADSHFKQAVTNRRDIPGYTDGHVMCSPVMSFSPNELGLYDLAGNLWEACVDDLNPSAPVFVLRGGCFLNSEEEYLNSSKRVPAPVGPGTVTPPVPTLGRGFRSVIELPPESTSQQATPAKTADIALPLDASKLDLVLDLDFSRDGSFRNLLNNNEMADVSAGELARTTKRNGVWYKGPGALNKLQLDDFICEVEARLAESSSKTSWGLGLVPQVGSKVPWASVFIRADGQVGAQYQGEIIPVTTSPALKSGIDKNRLRVEVRGKSVRVFVNDVFVAECAHLWPKPISPTLFTNSGSPSVDLRVSRIRVWK